VVLAPPGKPPLKIGEVANRSGLTVKTIRFYCDEGLIQRCSRSDGGYRLFEDGVFSELALIRTLRAMEIPLPDVGKILEARRSGVCTCSELKARIRSKAGEIGEKITAMQNLQAAGETELPRRLAVVLGGGRRAPFGLKRLPRIRANA